ncbi:MAG: TOBE domain-containing protein, partial [Firmicutes bacterium]|nr:TOBE domain-containing protein [Bacillota bacterium]
EPVDVVIRPEDIDIVEAEKGMLQGMVTQITFLGVFYEIIVDIAGFKWMIQTTDYAEPGTIIGLEMVPDAFHVMKKSEYSEMFGDYSSYSLEIDQLSENIDEEELEDEA